MRDPITVWQVCIEDQWRYATAETASFIACNDRTRVRLTEMPIVFGIRFRREPHVGAPRTITARRIYWSERRLRLEREAAPLFSSFIGQQQPDPVERIEAIDAEFRDWMQRQRLETARQWKECRRRLNELNRSARAKVLFAWSVTRTPATPVYFIDFLKRAQGGAQP